MRFSPLAVRGMSEVPVWRPLRDHSVSPWRIMKTRGVGGGIFFDWGWGDKKPRMIVEMRKTVFVEVAVVVHKCKVTDG